MKILHFSQNFPNFKPLWALHHVSLILCQIIGGHVQLALLTKLLVQFIEVHKSQLFQRL